MPFVTNAKRRKTKLGQVIEVLRAGHQASLEMAFVAEFSVAVICRYATTCPSVLLTERRDGRKLTKQQCEFVNAFQQGFNCATSFLLRAEAEGRKS